MASSNFAEIQQYIFEADMESQKEEEELVEKDCLKADQYQNGKFCFYNV